jgi:hypothetical protein
MVASTNGEKKPFIERGTRTTFRKMKKSRFRQKAVHVPTRDGGHELFRREWTLIAYCSGNSSCPHKTKRGTSYAFPNFLGEAGEIEGHLALHSSKQKQKKTFSPERLGIMLVELKWPPYKNHQSYEIPPII